MATLNRITNDLIVNALYMTGELGVGETPDAFMQNVSLEILNELLDKFSSDSIYIPYYSEYKFTLIPGKDSYIISDVITADIIEKPIADLTFANYTVQTASPTPIVYPLKIIDKAEFYNIVRLANLKTRPGFIFLTKEPQASIVTLYPAPDQPYGCSLKVKANLANLTNNDSLNGLPPFYYGFLKYALARKLLAYYPSANWPQTNEDEYQDYYNIVKPVNETNLVLVPSVVLDAPQPFYWPNILAY
jgi:hypothetical protein